MPPMQLEFTAQASANERTLHSGVHLADKGCSNHGYATACKELHDITHGLGVRGACMMNLSCWPIFVLKTRAALIEWINFSIARVHELA